MEGAGAVGAGAAGASAASGSGASLFKPPPGAKLSAAATKQAALDRVRCDPHAFLEPHHHASSAPWSPTPSPHRSTAGLAGSSAAAHKPLIEPLLTPPVSSFADSGVVCWGDTARAAPFGWWVCRGPRRARRRAATWWCCSRGKACASSRRPSVRSSARCVGEWLLLRPPCCPSTSLFMEIPTGRASHNESHA